ncbi:MAG TPA: helix-hairpin-helix domain-containing protein [Polyangiaceae bacterium]|nr:MAG: Helix-hairpin-helix motif protein [Deltaproteobacteria bacterium ADurb.Bin207]HNZ24038.1 helix-hairpin-helix domain-containing protein [Polyangiaceae bacterium]HOD21829.1 helix-hairpin-helix domain-containing protein [Polyangiaceae bacterium]HOH01903.1 helix-hairpin-helix domain-containing protein [Polyangiaceae bacterium]HOR35988.1 helix-hairpin-helix domain-containing protein [Polyangiaceae bacterium]
MAMTIQKRVEHAGWMGRVHRLVNGPWTGPVAKAGAVVGAVVLLSWLGMRSAQSSVSPSGQLDPEMMEVMKASLVAGGGEASAAPMGSVAGDAGASPGRAVGVLPDGRIVLNAASAEELCKLPGIGPARAAKIVELRGKLGGFRSVRQLLRVKGIGPRMLKRLTPLVVLDAPVQGESRDGG